MRNTYPKNFDSYKKLDETHDNTQHEIKIKSFFHNQFRNIGVAFTLFLTALAYSRVFRKGLEMKDRVQDMLGIIMAIIFLGISIINGILLWTDIGAFGKKYNSNVKFYKLLLMLIFLIQLVGVISLLIVVIDMV